jgi:hypothetical protein
MRITSGGNVGIGTTTPAKKLDVYDSNGNATAQIKLRNAGSTPAAYLGAFSGNLYLSAGGTYDSGWTTDGTNGVANIVMETSNGGSAIAFGTVASNTAPSERMRIKADGSIEVKKYISFGLDYSATQYLNISENQIYRTGGGTLYINNSGTGAVAIAQGGGLVGFNLPANGTGTGIEFSASSTTPRFNWLVNSTYVGEINATASSLFTIKTNNTSSISLQTNNTERMKIMSGGGIGYGVSPNTGVLRATLVKTGTTSITFNMSLGTTGAWRPGFATIRVSGAQNGLQEYWAAWYIVRITGYFGAGTSINVLSSGGDTSAVSLSSSSDQNSPQAFSITVTDSGATTNTMIADLDVAYHEGIISLT